jgi:peptidyl-prolyl cis-trans isomerase B (cyclophilin B)
MTTLIATLVLGLAPTAAANPRVEMAIENRGVVVMELFPDKAPKTVQQFLGLVNSNFYDGILFHRVENNPRPFIVVSGYRVTMCLRLMVSRIGTGGCVKNLPFEKNDVAFTNGTVGLSREKNDPNSGDSQFFITLGPQPFLEGTYVAFGRVIRGMEVVKSIRVGDRIVAIRIIE